MQGAPLGFASYTNSAAVCISHVNRKEMIGQRPNLEANRDAPGKSDKFQAGVVIASLSHITQVVRLGTMIFTEVIFLT